jgi:Ca2+-binding EF-hand superfamily protein
MGMNNFIPSREDVRSWMKMTDKNSDGKVSLAEYEELVIRSLKNAGIKIYDD